MLSWINAKIAVTGAVLGLFVISTMQFSDDYIAAQDADGYKAVPTEALNKNWTIFHISSSADDVGDVDTNEPPEFDPCEGYSNNNELNSAEETDPVIKDQLELCKPAKPIKPLIIKTFESADMGFRIEYGSDWKYKEMKM